MAKKQKKTLSGKSANHKVPYGVKGKGGRMCLQPPGSPSGVHDPKMGIEKIVDGQKIFIKTCRCGRCTNDRLQKNQG